MAKPTKHATLICTALTVLALIGILLGILTTMPLIIILFLLPTVVYEVYRSEEWHFLRDKKKERGLSIRDRKGFLEGFRFYC